MINIGNVIDKFINTWGTVAVVVLCITLSATATIINTVALNDIKNEVRILKSEAIRRNVACWADDNGRPKFAWKEIN